MYHTSGRPASGRIALMQGAIFGGIMGGIKLIITMINVITGLDVQILSSLSKGFHLPFSTAGLINTVIWTTLYAIIGLGVFFLAGMQATRQTGTLGTGVLAGLFAGLFYGILSLLIALGMFLTITLPNIVHLGPAVAGSLATSLIVSLVISNLMTSLLIVGLIVGPLAGLLGGAVGQSSARGGIRRYGAVPMTPPEQWFG